MFGAAWCHGGDQSRLHSLLFYYKMAESVKIEDGGMHLRLEEVT